MNHIMHWIYLNRTAECRIRRKSVGYMTFWLLDVTSMMKIVSSLYVAVPKLPPLCVTGTTAWIYHTFVQWLWFLFHCLSVQTGSVITADEHSVRFVCCDVAGGTLNTDFAVAMLQCTFVNPIIYGHIFYSFFYAWERSVLRAVRWCVPPPLKQ